MLSLPPLPSGIRPLKNDEFERLHTRFPTMPLKPGGSHCVTCRGMLKFSWLDDKGVPADYECDCVNQWALNHYFQNANIGLTYQRLRWVDMDATEQGALDKCKAYLENSEAYVRAGVGLILYGEMGTGKTALSSLLLKSLLAIGYDGYFTTFSEMIDTYTGGWNDRDDKAWFHKRIKNAGVLVLDDVGKEYQGRAKSGLPESTFDEVLRHRVAASTPTIITTNHDMKSLQEGYGGNVMSLLHERSTTYRFTGADFRNSARHRILDEAESCLTRPVVVG